MRIATPFAVVGLLFALFCPPAPADVLSLDFETNPEDLGVQFHGTAEWRESEGNPGGYLAITDALNSQRGAIVFPDLSGGQPLTQFSISADLRVGGGTARPADGFSFNFARPDDPVLDDGEDWAASPTGEANLPEEGTTTGLAIGFDEWFSGGEDVVGMSIRIDNELVDQFEFPTLNGALDDDTSLQTGPEGVQDFELDMLGWAKLNIKLTSANLLTVDYKGVEVFNQTIDYAASPGLLVFGGRTGGANAYHHIDNIEIRTGDDVLSGGPGLTLEWFNVDNPGNKAGVDNIFATQPLQTPPFRADWGSSWWTGNQAAIAGTVKYPPQAVASGTNANDEEQYTVRSTGFIKIPESGNYKFTDGIDDFTYLAIDADRSGVAGDSANEVIINDNAWTNLDRSAAPGGPIGEISFSNVPAGGEWLALEFNMAEGTGTDAGIIYWDYDTVGNAGVGGATGFPATATARIAAANLPNLYIPNDYLWSGGTPPAIAVGLEAGDADQDLDFDQLDLVKVSIAAKYLTGNPATWGEGDWNGAPGGSPGNPPAGDSRFNQADIIAALNSNNYLMGPYAALANANGARGDAQTSIIYNAGTGEVAVDAPAGTNLTSVNIDSAGRIFTGAPAANLGGSFDNDSDNNIFKATFGSSFGSLSFGNVAQAGLSQQFVLNDLTVVGSLAGGGALGNVDLIYIPEPSTIVLVALGLAGVGLMRLRRKQ